MLTAARWRRRRLARRPELTGVSTAGMSAAEPGACWGLAGSSRSSGPSPGWLSVRFLLDLSNVYRPEGQANGTAVGNDPGGPYPMTMLSWLCNTWVVGLAAG